MMGDDMGREITNNSEQSFWGMCHQYSDIAIVGDPCQLINYQQFEGRNQLFSIGVAVKCHGGFVFCTCMTAQSTHDVDGIINK